MSISLRRFGSACLIGSVAYLLMTPPAGGADSKDVVVTNDPANPVPTTAVGTTTVAGSVNIGNTSPILVRSADEAARHPFQFEVHVTVPSNSLSSLAQFQVPAGKLAEFEFVSVGSNTPNGGNNFVSVATRINGLLVDHIVPLVAVVQNGFVGADAGHVVKFYADGGTTVDVILHVNAGPAQTDGNISLSGVLIDQ